MALTTRVECVVLLLTLLFNGYEYTKLKDEQQQLSTNKFWVRDDIGEYTPNEEQPLDLQSVFGKDWQNENKPLSQDELASILADIFGPKDGKGVESSTQNYFKPNVDILFGSESNTQYTNSNSNKVPLQGTSKKYQGKNDLDSTFSTQTVFPFKVFDQGGVIPVSSSYRPDIQSTSSPNLMTTSFKIDTYATTSRYPITLNPIFTGAGIASGGKPTDANIKNNTDDEVSTSPSLIPENTEAKPNIPSHWFVNQNAVKSNGLSNPNVIRPNYEPQFPIRPNFGYSYYSGIHNFRPHFMPFSQSGEQITSHHRTEFRPHGYHYHRHHYHRNAPSSDFQHNYQTIPVQWSNGWTNLMPIKIPRGHNHHRHRHYHPGPHLHYRG